MCKVCIPNTLHIHYMTYYYIMSNTYIKLYSMP